MSDTGRVFETATNLTDGDSNCLREIIFAAISDIKEGLFSSVALCESLWFSV